MDTRTAGEVPDPRARGRGEIDRQVMHRAGFAALLLGVVCLGLLMVPAPGCKQASKFNPFERKDTLGRVIASVYDVKLHESELAQLNTKDKNKEDSTSMVREYVNNWVKQQLLLRKANENLN